MICKISKDNGTLKNFQTYGRKTPKHKVISRGLSILSGVTWRIIPISKWLVTRIYQPFRPFGRETTLFRGLTITMVINHLQVLAWSSKYSPPLYINQVTSRAKYPIHGTKVTVYSYKVYPLWNEHFRTWKWMVGRRSFPLGMAFWQVRTVSFREGM